MLGETPSPKGGPANVPVGGSIQVAGTTAVGAVHVHGVGKSGRRNHPGRQAVLRRNRPHPALLHHVMLLLLVVQMLLSPHQPSHVNRRPLYPGPSKLQSRHWWQGGSRLGERRRRGPHDGSPDLRPHRRIVRRAGGRDGDHPEVAPHLEHGPGNRRLTQRPSRPGGGCRPAPPRHLGDGYFGRDVSVRER